MLPTKPLLKIKITGFEQLSRSITHDLAYLQFISCSNLFRQKRINLRHLTKIINIS